VFDKWLIFIESHTRIVLGIGLLIVVFVLFNKYENHRHDEKVAESAVAQKQLQDAIENNKVLAAQVVAQQVAYNQLAAQVSTQNALIATQIAAFKTKTTQQQKIDANLSLTDLAKRWTSLIGAAETEISTVGNTLSVSEQASHKTVEQLEMVDPLHQEVLAGHQVEDNLNKQLTGLTTVNTAQAAQITGLNDQIQKADTACKTQLALAKPTFFGKVKSALKSFGIGVGVGVILAHKF
jgi:hypothetical protein